MLAEAQHSPETGVWIVYDGDCPLCRSTVHAYRLKETFGALYLIDARDEENAPSWLMDEIQKKKYDLDAGMLIYADGRYHHAEDAVIFMAIHGDDKGNAFTKLMSSLFRNQTIAKISYPFLRFGRNVLLKIRGKEQIKNL